MKISDLLELLGELQGKHGDIDVQIEDRKYPNADVRNIYYDDDSNSAVIVS